MAEKRDTVSRFSATPGGAPCGAGDAARGRGALGGRGAPGAGARPGPGRARGRGAPGPDGPDGHPPLGGRHSLTPVDLDLLARTLAELGQPPFRARQAWSWAARGAPSYEAMTDLPRALRRALVELVPFSTLTVEHEARARDGTMKALFRTADGRPVEAVLMRYRDARRSLCLSSQSGCPLTCAFCATGRMRFGRNLTTWEILDQALHFRRAAGAIDHAVFMGMGEPLMNVDAVLGACDWLPEIGITARRTAISTVGWIPGIERLTADPRPLRLALSLHAAEGTLRSQLMPVNDRYPLEQVLAACREHQQRTRRRVFVEYVMLAGVNDSVAQAIQLAELLDPRAFKVNLIPYNPTDARFRASGPRAIAAFRAELERRGLPVTVRLTRGRDIDAACGQLAARREPARAG
jgi:23S rRNA (adenine2503-C2)-methyltransferase